MRNLFLMRANKLFTRKKDLKTNRKDVLNAEKQGNSREIIVAIDILIIDISCQMGRRGNSPFFIWLVKNDKMCYYESAER